MSDFFARVVHAVSKVERKYSVRPTHLIVGYEMVAEIRSEGDLARGVRFGLKAGEADTYVGLTVAIDRSMEKGEFIVAFGFGVERDA